MTTRVHATDPHNGNDDYRYSSESIEKVPVIIKHDEEINIKRACHLAGKTDRTIRSWCKDYGIGGAMPGSPLRISAPALMMVVHGDIAALELLRDGHRRHPRVSRYFETLGIAS